MTLENTIDNVATLAEAEQNQSSCYIDANYPEDRTHTIGYVIIGDRVLIKDGARVRNRGFGFHMDANGRFDIPQLGIVNICNNVHIGVNTVVDRGSFADTVICNNVRICNLVQITHSVDVGHNSILVAQVGLAGSTELGKFVIAAGQAGISDRLTIGNGIEIAANICVMRDLQDGLAVAGIPAVLVNDWHRQTVA